MKNLVGDADQVLRHAVRALAESFEHFYENSIAIDNEHRITWISDGYRQFLGIKHSPLGKPIVNYIKKSYLPQVADSGEPVFLDLLFLRNQWILVSVIPLTGEQGEIIGAFGFVAIDDGTQLGTLANRFNNLQRQLETVTNELHKARHTKYRLSQISGRSEVLQSIKNQVRQAARFDISVLLTGETGTGKELFAHALHELSSRADKAFISLNMSAIPTNLIEAEFFGVAPGAYTGASKGGRKGKLELADGGTLFLDEIGDMPLELQSKLLRALQEQEFEPVGSNQVKKVNIRIVAATSRNLTEMMEEGTFRPDLYYRLNGMPIHLPPLRDRINDIDLMAERILDELSSKLGMPPKFFAADAISVLTQYHWPGNVRELHNVLERAMILSEASSEIKASLLSSLLSAHPMGSRKALEHSYAGTAPQGAVRQPPVNQTHPAPYAAQNAPQPLHIQLAHTELNAIRHALAYTEGHKGKAAKALGISRATLYEKLKKLGELDG